MKATKTMHRKIEYWPVVVIISWFSNVIFVVITLWDCFDGITSFKDWNHSIPIAQHISMQQNICMFQRWLRWLFEIAIGNSRYNRKWKMAKVHSHLRIGSTLSIIRVIIQMNTGRLKCLLLFVVFAHDDEVLFFFYLVFRQWLLMLLLLLQQLSNRSLNWKTEKKYFPLIAEFSKQYYKQFTDANEFESQIIIIAFRFIEWLSQKKKKQNKKKLNGEMCKRFR